MHFQRAAQRYVDEGIMTPITPVPSLGLELDSGNIAIVDSRAQPRRFGKGQGWAVRGEPVRAPERLLGAGPRGLCSRTASTATVSSSHLC